MANEGLVPEQARQLRVAQELAKYYADPVGYVLAMWEWGKGRLVGQYPEKWQLEVLTWLGEQIRDRAFDGTSSVLPIRKSVSSGHGTGKSCLSAWIILFLMHTRPHMQGVVTAATDTQLNARTWGQLTQWHNSNLFAKRWFDRNTERYYFKGSPDEWKVVAQTCKRENAQAFAGQHARDSTSLYIFDEASEVPDEIFEVHEGGLTDGCPMTFQFGNMVRNEGHFYESCFGELRHLWHPMRIDSRDVRLTNKELIQQWIDTYGIDSDFIRKRVLGLAPRAAVVQFIEAAFVDGAVERELGPMPEDVPLVCGADMSRGGDDETVFRFRRGRDARSIPAWRFQPPTTRDAMKLAGIAQEILESRFLGNRRVEMMFVDASSSGGAVCDRLRELGYGGRVTEVDFGGASPKREYANMRSFIWGEMRDWLKGGCLPREKDLRKDLVGPEWTHNTKNRIVLEPKELMKKRGLPSPDDGDALACTFAGPVMAHQARVQKQSQRARRRRYVDLGERTQRDPRTDERRWMHVFVGYTCAHEALRMMLRMVDLLTM